MKQGQVTEPYVIIIFLIIFGLLAIIVYNFLITFNAQVGSSLNTVAEEALSNVGNAFSAFDNSYIFLIGGLILALIISAFYIPTNPVFFVVFLITLIAYVAITPTISNMFVNLTSNAAFTDGTEALPNLVNYTSHLPLIVLIAGALFIIALYAKSRFT